MGHNKTNKNKQTNERSLKWAPEWLIAPDLGETGLSFDKQVDHNSFAQVSTRSLDWSAVSSP